MNIKVMVSSLIRSCYTHALVIMLSLIFKKGMYSMLSWVFSIESKEKKMYRSQSFVLPFLKERSNFRIDKGLVKKHVFLKR